MAPNPPFPPGPAGAPPFGGPPNVGGPPAPVGGSPSAGSGRSRGRLVALVVGAALIIGAGVFGITRLGGGDSDAGGADSPEEAGMALLAALEDEDVLGMVDVLLPGERETMRAPMSEMIDELRRVEVLSDEASLTDLSGFDVEIDEESVDVEETNVDDIANVRVSGLIRVTVDGESIPLGDLVVDNLPDDTDMSELDTESPTEAFELPITVVSKDGRWYVSAFYTLAEQVRSGYSYERDLEIPDEGITPTGGDSPEDAFDAFLDATAGLDLEGVIASLNPNEFEALQRYAPLFLDSAQEELDDVDVDIRLEEASYDSSVDGDTASIAVTYLAGQIEAEGDTVSFAFEDGCITVDVPGEETFNSCELDEGPLDTDEIPPEAQEVVDTFTAVFDDYENPGIIMKRVDGTWYLSPMASGAEQALAVLRAIDRDEVEDAGRALVDIAEEVEDGDFELGPITGDDDISTADTVVIEDPDTTDPVTTDFVELPEDECYATDDTDAAVDCFAGLIASGELEETDVAAEMRFPQCGMADAYWHYTYWDMSDAEYVALVEQANACFLRLVDAGEIVEDEIPYDARRPECLEGRNRYLAADEDAAYEERFYDCLFG